MFALREPTATDVGFVVDSWAKCLRTMFERRRKMHGDDYFPWAQGRINALLARPKTELRVLGPEGDAWSVEGWACLEGSVLHFVYVASRARGLGATKLLLGDRTIAAYSHLTKMIDERRLPASWQPKLTLGVLA